MRKAVAAKDQFTAELDREITPAFSSLLERMKRMYRVAIASGLADTDVSTMLSLMRERACELNDEIVQVAIGKKKW